MITCPKCGELKTVDEMSITKANIGPNGWCNLCVMAVGGTHKVRIVKASKEILERMYVKKLMTLTEIAKELGVDRVTIGVWLKSYEIPMRTKSEAGLLADRGGKNCNFYIDGRAKEGIPYCDKFDEKFKERNRDFFYRICQNCGITELEQKADQKNRNKRQFKLSVHHVFYNKNTCCDNSERLLVPLCASCHNEIDKEDPHYEYVFAREIREKYNGICFFPKYMTDPEERKAYRRVAINGVE